MGGPAPVLQGWGWAGAMLDPTLQENLMPVIAWLLGVPITVIILFMLLF